MIVLHALWAGRRGLGVWGESSTGYAEQRPLPVVARRSDTILPHGFTCRPADAFEALAGRAAPEKGPCAALCLRLPSNPNGPAASPELMLSQESPASAPDGLRAWSVPAWLLAGDEALELLPGLPEPPRDGVVAGGSLRFWVECARFALELIARECFVPVLETGAEPGTGTVRAGWRPLLDGQDLARRDRLARSMPAIARALVDGPTPGELVQDFLNQTIDAWVRCSGAAPRPKRKSTARRRPGVAENWQAALSGPDGNMLAAERDELRRLQDWLGAGQPASPDAPFRLCFRLDAPETDAPAKAGHWQLNYLLQANDDRSLLVPAEQVWRTRSADVSFLKRRFENPQERLLADLGRAARLSPTIEESLDQACPVGVELATNTAYSFLRETAPLLEQSGFGVLLPAWWQRPGTRLGVKLQVRAPQGAKVSAGLMSASAIVAYQWQVALGDEQLSLEEFKRLAGLKTPLVRVRGQWVELKRDEVESAIAFFERQRTAGEMALTDALRLGLGLDRTELGLPVTGISATGELESVLNRLTQSGRMESIATPGKFRGELRPYQQTGLAWLAFLSQLGLGACLADDMGLGKTIQLIALTLHERRKPTLLICPMSVVENWRKELARFAPSLKVLVHHGSERLQGKAFERKAARQDIVATTYALALRDEALFGTVDWERVVLDEAQNIKSHTARQTQAIKRLKARHRVALTGTPVENRLSELWSIMDFLNPGYLRGAADFHKSFSVPVERYHDADRAATLKRLVQPYVLRRLKTDKSIIRDLPEKVETKVFCNLTPEQATLYEAVVQEMLAQIDAADDIKRRGLVLAALTKLKQICDHPVLFVKDGSAVPGRSGKLSRLEAMLEEVLAEGDKALVFTQFAELGGLVKPRLQEALNREVLFLHGGTPRKQRTAMIERFQDPAGPSVFLLSLKAGGLGLNLTAANHVFHFDRWWNPAVENQATDRVFRIGQKKNVQVHKFVCLGTLEEKIDEMIERKKALAELVVGAGEGWITEMTTAQLRELFTLSRSAVAEGEE